MKRYRTTTDSLEFKSPYDRYSDECRHHWDVIVRINKKYGFKQEGRSPRDVATFESMHDALQRIEDAYRLMYPPVPCPGCGHLLRGILPICTNFWDGCPEATPLGG